MSFPIQSELAKDGSDLRQIPDLNATGVNGEDEGAAVRGDGERSAAVG